MAKRRKAVDTQRVVVLFTQQHLTLKEIGRIVGLSDNGVRGRLLAAGVHREDGTWVDRECAWCGDKFKQMRCIARKTLRAYCCADHYYASRHNPGYVRSQYRMRLARAVVAQHFKLLPEYVVHHEDGDNHHNDLDNLRVFASQEDHLKYHHAKRTGEYAPLPLWSGLAS